MVVSHLIKKLLLERINYSRAFILTAPKTPKIKRKKLHGRSVEI